MAKFHSYYVLCPLIDQKSFLGVAQDIEEECVVVSLGRNVVNKYRLSDQKQIRGWTSRDHITSTVIYDKDQDCYVGVFNNNVIKMWKEDAGNLDKVKKYKFAVNILKLVPRGDQASLIVFSNGNCAALPYAIDNRKTYESKSLLKDTETIVDIACYNLNGTDHVCYVIKNMKDNYEIINCPVRNELCDLDKSKLSKIKVTRADDVHVVGELISTVDKMLAVYILWSDSKMTMYDLTKKTWKTIGTAPWVSTLNSVSLAWMGKNHLLLFGRNLDQDGAIIVAYNVNLGVGSCKYPMKMYFEDSKLYCFNGRIIMEASNHIGMLPYMLETKRNLSNLLGSHLIGQGECTEIVTWDTPTELLVEAVIDITEHLKLDITEDHSENEDSDTAIPLLNVADNIKKYLKLGITERSICSQLIPSLLEKKDIRNVLMVIKEFKDIPESMLVQLLNYTIKSVKVDNIDVTNHDKFVTFCSAIEEEKFKLLNHIFEIAFSDALLIPYLRNGLTLNDTLFLMSYISYLLVDSDVRMDADYESKLLDWCTLLMDAFYQQYLMTKDEKVTYVLRNTLNIVVSLVKELSVVDNTMMSLNKFLSGKDSVNEESLSYSIEIMQI